MISQSKKTNPIQTQFLQRLKMNANVYSQKDYENETTFRPQKNKSKQTQLQTQRLSKLFLAFTFLCPSYNLAMQTWTIQKLLNWVTEHLTDKGIDSPRLSAELLLSHVVGLKRIELYTQFDKAVDKQQLDKLHDLVKRAGQNEPIPYLVGKTEFYSLELNVTPDCMIPRPETELLVERAIEFLRTRSGRNSTMGNTLQKGSISNGARTATQFVCDLCTGSGCIAVAIAKNFPDARIIATDICDAALAVAAGNVEKHQLGDQITLLCGDLFDPIMPQLDVNEFDLIVCNPPYVSTAEYEKLDRNVKDYEPKVALFAGVDGLDIYRRVIEKADRFLKPNAALMLEIGYAQGPAIKKLLEQTSAFAEIRIEKDPHNNDRIAIAKKQKRLDREK
jgi:release factor glutamine methyltransferase